VTPELLEGYWARLPVAPQADRLVADEIGTVGIWVARDNQGQPHVLVRLDFPSRVPPFDTRGLRVEVGERQVADGPSDTYLDLVCLDDTVAPTFAVVAADVATLAENTEPTRRGTVLAAALSRWRWFWRVDSGGLSETDVVGLFAELWFLAQWAGADVLAVAAWTGSDNSRHDFQWAQVSVEVKATTRRGSSGGVSHHINSLDQLADPETGVLHLFSMRLRKDDLARNTLPALVDQIDTALGEDPEAHEEFSRKLAARGYSPAHRGRYRQPHRVIEEKLYRVTDRFPRLLPSSFPHGLPDGITDVAYMLDTVACGPWLVADGPHHWTLSGAANHRPF